MKIVLVIFGIIVGFFLFIVHHSRNHKVDTMNDTPQIANKDSWKREAFGETIEIPFNAEYTQEEYETIIKGLVPQEMEDKWFIYYEEPYLFFHRSWTGIPVYQLKVEKESEKYRIQKAFYSKELLRDNTNLEYEAKLAGFIISNLLLNQNKPFPKPANIKEPMKGVYQHGISGTGYSESTVE